MKRAVFPEYLVPISGEWQRLQNKAILAMPQAQQELIDEYIYQYQMNPLAFILVHGRPNEKGNEVLDMINNHTDDLILLTAPNQCGKSYQAGGYMGLRLVPTDPSWYCYKHHGVEYHEWKGPQIAIVASYTWDAVNIVWQTYQKILPREELGQYAPNYGIFPGETLKPRNLGFSSGQTKEITLKCGSKIVFLCYRQSLAQWESRQCDIAHCDEQIPEDYYDALTARQTTRGDYTPIIMSLTGHVIPDRPDTGAAGWIKTKIVDQGLTKGRRVAQYKIAMEDVPDAFISKEKKAQLYYQWVTEPQATNNEKKLREAEARFWGGWEVGGALTFSEFNPEIHVIEPFDYQKYKPTYYRMIDYGEAPCAAGLFAMMPWGDCVMVKEYYSFGRSFEEDIVGIITELSGNERRKVDIYEDNGMMWPIYEEVYKGIEPFSSEMDVRSFGRKVKLISGRNVGQMYNQLGLTCSPSSGLHDKLTIPMVHAWMGLDKSREHINRKIGRKYPDDLARFGSPRLYIFNTCENAISEITRYMGKDVDDHLISTIKFLCGRDRMYHGDYGRIEAPKQIVVARNSLTGY